jgi:heat shock protein HtpX
MQRDASFRGRILLTLGLIVLIDAVVVALFALLAYPWLAVLADPIAGVVGPEAAPFARWLVVFVPVLVAFVWAQLRFTRRELLADVTADRVTLETHPDLHARFQRLARQAGVSPPTLAVADSDVPNSFALGGVRNAHIVVSQGLLDALSDDELDTVLAHELAHVQNRDATVMTLASFLPALVSDDRTVFASDGANVAVWLVLVFTAYLLSSAFVPGRLFGLQSVLGFVTLVAITVVAGGLVLGALTAPVVVLSRRLSETREFVADRAAAINTGDPSALVTALEKLDDQALDLPSTDARARYSGVDGLCFLPHGFRDTAPDSATDADDVDAQFTVETRSHPPTHERVARLRDVAAEL